MDNHIELDQENTLVNLIDKYEINLENPQEVQRIDNLIIREILEAHKRIVCVVDDFTRIKDYVTKVQKEYSEDLSSDFKYFPHKVFANAVLIDEKIVSWKICDRKWTKSNFVMFHQPQIVLRNLGAFNLKIVSWSKIVNDNFEHNEAFQKDAVNFFRQWKIHPDADMPCKPY